MLENGLNVLEHASSSFSFFSGHSANSFGLATCTVLGFHLDKRLKYKGYATWMYFWATMVAISRIFVGKHYLGDILAGSLVGIAAGFVIANIAGIIIKRYIK
jgi:undecaprenyl-diphosphatase